MGEVVEQDRAGVDAIFPVGRGLVGGAATHGPPRDGSVEARIRQQVPTALLAASRARIASRGTTKWTNRRRRRRAHPTSVTGSGVFVLVGAARCGATVGFLRRKYAA